jgi:predicted dehydrogenase
MSLVATIESQSCRALGLATPDDRLAGRGRPTTSDWSTSAPQQPPAEQAIAALEAGKHVACEKPLAGTLADARAMVAAAADAPGTTSVWFNYRRVPAVALAHRLVAAGRIGRIYHVRASYLQSWGGPDTPLLWRFQGDIAGSGAHGDLNAHIIDSVRFVTGQEIVTIEGAIEKTFIEERAVLEGDTGGEIAGAGASTSGATAPARRRGAVLGSAEWRGSSQLRGNSSCHRLSQCQPSRDPR